MFTTMKNVRKLLVASALFCAGGLFAIDSVFLDVSKMETLPKPWSLRTGVKGARGESLLVAPPALEMKELEIDPGLTGPYRIVFGLYYEKPSRDPRYYGAAVHVRLDGEPYRIVLESRQRFAEREFKIADMTGRKVVVSTLSERPCTIDYLRFVPVSAEAFAAEQARLAKPAERDVVGINDVNVWMWLYTTRSEWDFRDTIGQHVHAGFNRIYWMLNAGAVFYHTEVGTPYQRDTREFTPRSGYMVEHFRPLESGVKAARELDVELFGWYRLNNNFASKSSLAEFGPGLNSRFFMEHPEWRIVNAKGKPRHSHYSFAYPEVRAYVRSLCVEVARKGVDGLILDLLRHPPLAGFEPPLVEGFQKEYGIDPRTIRKSDATRFAQWTTYRARHSFTLFVEELAEDLKRIGKPIPLGLRCSLAPFAWNRNNGMDVEDLVKRGLIKELCLMNGYLSRPELTYEPAAIATASAPYFDLVKGRDVKMICGLHGRSPRQTETYADFIHDAGYDGVAFYETDVFTVNPDYVKTFRTLRDRRQPREPWITTSAALPAKIPWSTEEDGAWWQLNLPVARSLTSLEVKFDPDPASVELLARADRKTGEWLPLGVLKESGKVKLPDAMACQALRLRVHTDGQLATELCQVTATFTDGVSRIGDQRDGRVRIRPLAEKNRMRRGTTLEALVEGNPERSHVVFFWDGLPVRTERHSPYTWSTPKTLRPGLHRFKVCLLDNPLAPSVDEMEITVVGDPVTFEPLPAGFRVLRQDDFEAAPLGVCDELPAPWYFTTGYGREETRGKPVGRAKVVQTGGSRALHLQWSGEGPRMKLHFPAEPAVRKGMVEFDVLVPPTKKSILAGLYEKTNLSLAMYIADKGTKMTYHDGRNSHHALQPPATVVAGQWRRVRWSWDAGATTQSISVDDLQSKPVETKGFRQKVVGGIDSFAVSFFENQPAELYIDNVRILVPDESASQKNP